MSGCDSIYEIFRINGCNLAFFVPVENLLDDLGSFVG